MPRRQRTADEGPADAIRRGRARLTLTGARAAPVLLWGVLLAVGGVVTWVSVPRGNHDIPELWSLSATSAGAAGQMVSDIRIIGREAPPILRLEWPEHPAAAEYRIRFRVAGQPGPRPLATANPVFLYDLGSNVLGLPDEFEWAVAAVLPDGSEVVSPWQRYPEPFATAP